MDMAQLALVTKSAFTLVCKVRTLVGMQLGALVALLTGPQAPKSGAVGGCWVEANVRKATVFVIATPFLEVETGRRVIG
jgi:hypothetical protein